MTASARSHGDQQALDLPPAFRLATLREHGDAFLRAQAIADELGAGTIVWTRRFDLAEFAVILEPEEPLRSARRAFELGMAALAAAIASHCPPALPLAIDWPGTIRFDGAIIGGGRLAWPPASSEDVRPRWLVFGAMLRLHAMKEVDPGLHTLGASLFDVGFEDADAGVLIESFARRLLALSDQWAQDGPASVASHFARWLSAPPPESDAAALREALVAEPAWRDPETGEPEAMKLLRTIRLDASDTFVFDRAAEPGEAAVSGAFAFWDEDVSALQGKRRAAFRGGFLGVASGGFSTLAQVCEADQDAVDGAVEELAALLVREHGAPDLDAARPAAREEIASSLSLADHAPGVLIALHRSLDDRGEIREQFRTLQRRPGDSIGRDGRHDRVFSFFETDEGEAPAEDVDFAAMLKDRGV